MSSIVFNCVFIFQNGRNREIINGENPNSFLLTIYSFQIWHNLWNTYQDNATSLASRVKKTDAREIQAYYQQYYEQYVRALDQADQADR